MNKFEVEYRGIRYKSARPNKKILIFAIGGLIGIIFFYIFNTGDIILDESFWNEGFAADEHTKLFQYVFAIRFKQLLFLMICSFSYFGYLLAYGILGYLGFEYFLILFTFVYNYKIKGIMLGIEMILPHGIFYLLLLLVVFERCYDNEIPRIYKGKAIVLWKIIMGVILFLLGYLCETCINIEVLKWVLQIQ